VRREQTADSALVSKLELVAGYCFLGEACEAGVSGSPACERREKAPKALATRGAGDSESKEKSRRRKMHPDLE
jgi:hypothetical protein